MSPWPAPRDAGGDVTSDRRETKYLVPLEQMDGLVNALRENLTLHRFTGEGANPLPGAHHYITTIYFDTPSGQHYRAATGGARSVKVRAREYYDVHPSLAEVATSSDDLLRYDPWLWFELKRRGAGHSEKRRFRLAKRDVPVFFARVGPRDSAFPPASAPRAETPDQHDELTAIEAYLRDLDEPLAATCLVNYRRVAWQSQDTLLRVTLDLHLSCYAPLAELFTREKRLERGLLGRPRFSLDEAVFEVKARGVDPPWLTAAIRRASLAPVEFSKFVVATQSVHAHG